MFERLISDNSRGALEHAVERKFSLPFGYEATFRWHRSGLTTLWSPSVPFVRKTRARRKFFAAYQVVRRSFLEEVAAVVGGNVLILDTTDLNVVSAEIVHRPTRH